ncbi:EBNA1BP2 [Branchiostoma lanceolatum]|uniref:EBNA1BP2 protein n=1 Tax=Branchiostoma lanceolatum TaxID=7740 RepID=A0A8J9YY55_BRALA|nr:EBNA1BP2 [Branchiostoma lanceolatum]
MAATIDSDAESVESFSGSDDSDRELMEAYKSGLLKPGLNIELPAPRQPINNVAGLKQKLADFRQDLDWLERLDVTTDPAPMPAAMAEVANIEAAKGTTGRDLDVHNDFQREMTFYRQAQAAVISALPRLQKLGVPTTRPEDYFAEMAKSDVHMKKVRERLLSKQQGLERAEKVRKVREMRKYGKQVQQEVLLKRQREKKELIKSVKEYRKGKIDNLDFLDDEGPLRKGQPTGKKGQPTGKKGGANRNSYKQKKFGFGGQKKRSKWNTEESSADMSGFKSGKKPKGPPGKKGQKGKQPRPGKNRRQKMKGGKRR